MLADSVPIALFRLPLVRPSVPITERELGVDPFDGAVAVRPVSAMSPSADIGSDYSGTPSTMRYPIGSIVRPVGGAADETS